MRVKSYYKFFGFIVLFIAFSNILPLGVSECFAQAAQVKITDMDDLAFGTWTTVSAVENTDSVCIYKTRTGNLYTVTATGTGSGGSFYVQYGSYSLRYYTYFAGSDGVFTQVAAGATTQFGEANKTSQTCGGLSNAQVKVRFELADLEMAQPGTYSGVLSIRIDPV